MAGIYPPQRGHVTVEGHVCPLFEFVTGFEMEATGWENIRTRALLLGMMPEEIDRKIESIAKFSNLGEFLYIPVRHYSTGMYVRLAFATSTAVDPQILLLDEVMAAGDVAFIESARERMNDLMERASLVVFATHSLDVLPRFCERTILMRKGCVVADGPTEDVVRLYTEGPTGHRTDARRLHPWRLIRPTRLFTCSCRCFVSTNAWPRSASASRTAGPASVSRPTEFEEAVEALHRPAARPLPEFGDRRPAPGRAHAQGADGWRDGDEVITTPLTFVSTNHAILYEELRPVFADVDEYLCLDPESVAERITPRTRAVIFVGLGGNAGRLDDIAELAARAA